VGLFNQTVHFVIKAPDLAQMFITMVKNIQILGHLKFDLGVRHAGF